MGVFFILPIIFKGIGIKLLHPNSAILIITQMFSFASAQSKTKSAIISNVKMDY